MTDSTPPADLRTPTAEDVARKFHEAYERLAPSYGYETREASRKPWNEVPANNRALMTAVVAELLADPAVLPAHRELVLGEAATAIEQFELCGLATDWGQTGSRWFDRAAEIVRGLAATGPADPPSDSVPAQDGPVVPPKATPELEARWNPVSRVGVGGTSYTKVPIGSAPEAQGSPAIPGTDLDALVAWQRRAIDRHGEVIATTRLALHLGERPHVTAGFAAHAITRLARISALETSRIGADVAIDRLTDEHSTTAMAFYAGVSFALAKVHEAGAGRG